MADDTTPTRFPFRFTGANKALALLGLTARTCVAEVDAQHLVVRFGWAFRCRVDRRSITAVGPDAERILGWGAHGWRHVWLVNGTSQDLTRVDIDPMARGRVLVAPLRIRALRLGIDDPESFRRALRVGRPPIPQEEGHP